MPVNLFHRLVFSFLPVLLFFAVDLFAVNPDSIYAGYIKSARLFDAGNQLSLPVINLQSGDQVELHFDDMEADVKYYYYTYQLCNSDWTPVNLSQFNYLKGYTQLRINTYRRSSIAYTRYTHYQALIPEKSMFPVQSGNYILKVFLDGDTSKLAFTKRLMVLDGKVTIAAKITQPFTPDLFRTHQRLQFTVDAKTLQTYNAAQQVKVVILQNFRWDNALRNLLPSFVRGSVLDFNSPDKAVFEGGKEWRWLDIRDFRLQSDRVLKADYKDNSTDIYLRPDGPRVGQRYIYYADFNGLYSMEATRGINPYWEADYARVNFTFVPPDGKEYTNEDVYLFGQLTNYNLTDSLRLQYDPANGIYKTHLFLKQGYYDYTYLVVNRLDPSIRYQIDGDYFETENLYTILVYYKSFTGRYDELVGVATLDSRTDRPGLSF